MVKGSLKNKVLFITGASRGIGFEIALRAARDGAKIAIVAKTTTAHPTLPGTIYTAAKDIEEAGGEALPIACDIRDEKQLEKAYEETVKRFGGIDIVVSNASAVYMGDTETTPVSRFDLMHQINVRGTWLVAKLAIKHLKKAENPHILIASPPINLDKIGWNVAYTISKYGMSMIALGLSQELEKYNIAVNSIWPVAPIETAALKITDPSKKRRFTRTPEIMADAVHHILCQDSKTVTGNLYMDEAVLREAGQTEFEKYNYIKDVGIDQLSPSFFLTKEQIADVTNTRPKL
ncbi:hypothetical protein BB558_005977 [Smittium angustum]|uniref:Hydroxysteroid dehydrogenase-like protein 2 n=1 Tax=Smittium angustum TaxID=133377 RepID=A0A2U1IYZ8_SMIAN|nr:hypothetical protein BB558_005977 [Smittium angustum]